MVAAGNVNCIEPPFFEFFCEPNRIFNRETVRFIVGTAQTDCYREVRTDFLADVLKNLEIDAGAVFKAATVHIGSVVGCGGEEVGEKVAVGSVDLYEFKACGFGAESCVAEAFYDLFDFRNGQLLRNRLVAVVLIKGRPRNCGGCFNGLGAEEFLASAVLNLDRGNRAHLSYIFCKPGKTGNMFVT